MARNVWLLVIVSLYVVACALPAFEWGRGSMEGYACLICIPMACVYPAWWANPLFFVGCGLLARRRPAWAWLCGLVALALAASFLLERKVMQIGFKFWLASMVLLTVAGLARVGRDRSTGGSRVDPAGSSSCAVRGPSGGGLGRRGR